MHRIYIDGAARGNPGPAAAGYVVLNDRGEEIHRHGTALGNSTNNRAEYEALIQALHYLLHMSDGIPEKPKARRDVKPAVILSDSELLVRQMNGVYRVRDPELIELNRKAKELIARLGGIKIIHIPRSQNRTADSIVNRVLNDHFKPA